MARTMLVVPGGLLAGPTTAHAGVEAGQTGHALREQVGFGQGGALIGHHL